MVSGWLNSTGRRRRMASVALRPWALPSRTYLGELVCTMLSSSGGAALDQTVLHGLDCRALERRCPVQWPRELDLVCPGAIADIPESDVWQHSGGELCDQRTERPCTT